MVAERILVLSDPAFAEQALDRSQDLPGLVADALAFRLIGDLAGEIDGRAVNDGLRHARPGVQSGDGHDRCSHTPNEVRDRAHEVALADLDAACAQDVVSRGQMKIEVRHGEMQEIVGAGKLQFVGAGGDDDLARSRRLPSPWRRSISACRASPGCARAIRPVSSPCPP